MKAPRFHRSTRRGFTLVEILLVVVILAMIAAFTVPNLLGTQEQVSIDSAKIQIKELDKYLKLYRTQNNSYPSTEQGLKALVEKPEGDPVPKKWGQIVDELPVDAWGNEYKYAFPGEHNGEKKPDLWSNGPDMQEGTDDDIGNWATEGGESHSDDQK